MTIKRVAVIFDNTLRPETTGLYCRRALGQFVEVEHFLPEERERIPPGFDLYLHVDDGLEYPVPDSLRPRAFWAIDTHLNATRTFKLAEQSDLVFVAQRQGAEQFQSQGMRSATWLPLACDPEFHRSHALEMRYDACFVGHVLPGLRAERIRQLQQIVPGMFVGQRYFEEMAKTYAASRVVFNQSVAGDLNMRVFEALACGRLLLTDDAPENGMSDLFRDGVHLATFRGIEELSDKLDYYLRNEAVRERIARQGQAEVYQRHTYPHRMSQLLLTAERHFSRTQVAVPAVLGSSPRPARCVSACLLSWKRPENVRRIVAQLLEEPLIDDIVIWNNAPETELAFDSERVRVISSPENLVTWGRFQAVKEAKHEIVFTQDDDCLVHNLPELYEAFCVDPSRIAYGLKLGHLLQNSHTVYGETQSVLLGWGACFRKEWVTAFTPYREQYGEDALLYRKADRLFGVLLNRRHRPLPASVTDLPGAEGPEALSVREDHFELTRHALARGLQLLANSSPRSNPPSARPTPTATPASAKDPTYFEHVRPEVLRLTPRQARRVLDVGCGAGRLGEALKARQPAVVVGIEGDRDAANRARTRLDQVIQGDLESPELKWPTDPFDAIVCADILEHLREPQAVLKRLSKLLTADGVLILSLPNLQHHSVVRSLLAGNFQYEPAGLLDEDHKTFFTRGTLKPLLKHAGFQVESVQFTAGEDYQEWSRAGKGSRLEWGRLQVDAGDASAMEPFFAYQYLVTARPALKGAESVTSPVEAEPTLDCSTPPDWFQKVLERLPQSAKRVLLVPPTGDPSPWDQWLLERATGECLIAALEEPAPQGDFDAILLLALDQQRHPSQWLDQQRLKLTEGGCLLVVVPTLRSKRRIGALLDGEWSPASPLFPLSTPQRFFTRRELEKLFARGHWAVHEMIPLQATGQFRESQLVKRDRRLTIAGQAMLETEELASDGYFILAYPESHAEESLTSIIVVTHNQLAYTRGCLESVRFLTDEPYELIVVDNGSTDGTVNWLKAQPDVRLIENPENRGFPAAVNQGLEVAGGEQILLLNNDTLATTGWLRRMLNCLDRDPAIGLVGPCSNQVSGEQQIPVDYDQLCDLDGFAWEWAKLHQGQTQRTDRLVGFCLLVRREVIEQVGQFDERFGIGCFEDDDYCRRAISAGYQCVIARDAFVHHFGSRTFLGSQADFAGILQRNQRLFEEKWKSESFISNHSVENGQKPHGTTFPRKWGIQVGEDGTFRLVPKQVRLSLCMIVRDNEHTIRPCLESIRPYVDEMIVVDTGSKDRTPEICEELGARVEYFPWCDDFSAARNESLKYAQGEWLFWMDSDDTIPPECGQKLRELADGVHEANCLGYVMQVHCPGSEPGDLTIVDHVKLFRNRPELQFEFRIHEQILPAIRRAGGEVAFTDIYVVHSGSEHTKEAHQRKLERDFRILQLDLAERPDHPFVLFNLGMTHADAEEHEEAVKCLERSIHASQAGESQLRKAYALLIGSLGRLERQEEAWANCQTALDLFPADPELRFRSGILLHQLGRLEEAATAYQKVLHDRPARHFHSVDAGLDSYKARHNLALVYEDLGRLPEAETQWRIITKDQPHYAAGWRGLGTNLLSQGNEVAVEALSNQILASRNGVRIEGQLLQSQLAERRGQLSEARNILEKAAKENPTNPHARHALARFLFERVNLAEAEPVLKALSTLVPDDASVWHNLGMIYLATKRHPEAAHAFQESLRLRPHSQATERLLDEVRQCLLKSRKELTHDQCESQLL